ncbi:uncharacterized protein B0H64DRAFT_102739 [Chaetomium fimeti]|uniref:Uncharacterized protein n=1 Tax=Chaetomium fimeti TaxID=1854472 RepID=A0AAE0HN72_9PEZI|nr:hypothetical protein B0H64DRAFT_102739 [Chaetomium fimeti]
MRILVTTSIGFVTESDFRWRMPKILGILQFLGPQHNLGTLKVRESGVAPGRQPRRRHADQRRRCDEDPADFRTRFVLPGNKLCRKRPRGRLPIRRSVQPARPNAAPRISASRCQMSITTVGWGEALRAGRRGIGRTLPTEERSTQVWRANGTAGRKERGKRRKGSVRRHMGVKGVRSSSSRLLDPGRRSARCSLTRHPGPVHWNHITQIGY